MLATGNDAVREMRTMLLRMSCLEHDFVVRGRPSMASGFGANQGSDMHYGANQQDSGDLPAAMLGGDDTAMHQGD